MQGAVARRRSLTKTDFLNLEIPFPPLDDQIRIAHLLGKVEGLIAQRKKHLQQLDDLLKSVFLEMFGDPVRNEKGWPINPLTIYMSEQPNNGLYKPQSSYGSGTKIIRIDSFYDGIVQNIEGLKRVQITDVELLKFEIRPFDVLVNRVNSIEYLGKIGVVPAISEPMVYESNMMRFRLNHEAMLPVFLMYFWRTPYLKSQINSKAKKAVNQASVNQQDVAGLLVPQTPIDLQKQFSTIVEKVEGIKSHYQQSLTDLEALYGALSQQAFKGVLDLSRVACLPRVQQHL
jgi:type I restriction enzyme S subunit